MLRISVLVCVFAQLTISAVGANGALHHHLQPLAAGQQHGAGASHQASSNLTVLLHETFFQKVIAEVLPVVVSLGQQLQVPAISDKHVDIDPIHLSAFDINNVSVTFAAPNLIGFVMKGLTLTVPQTHFCLKDEVLFVNVTCCGKFDVSLVDTNIYLEMALIDVNGTTQINKTSSLITFGALTIFHQFDEMALVCRTVEDLIEHFTGSVDNLIKFLVEIGASTIVSDAIKGVYNGLAEKIPLHVSTPPVATADSFQITFDLLSLLSSNKPVGKASSSSSSFVKNPFASPPQLSSASLESPLPPRDIEVWTNEESVEALWKAIEPNLTLTIPMPPTVNTSIFETLLQPAYDACPNCPLIIDLDLRQVALDPIFDSNFTIGVYNTILGISAYSNITNETIEIVDIWLNASVEAIHWQIFGPQNNTIRFNISIPVFNMAYKSGIDPSLAFEIMLLNGLVQYVVQTTLVNAFNNNFTGITIPALAGIIVPEDFAVSFSNQMAMFGLNLKLNPIYIPTPAPPTPAPTLAPTSVPTPSPQQEALVLTLVKGRDVATLVVNITAELHFASGSVWVEQNQTVVNPDGTTTVVMIFASKAEAQQVLLLSATEREKLGILSITLPTAAPAHGYQEDNSNHVGPIVGGVVGGVAGLTIVAAAIVWGWKKKVAAAKEPSQRSLLNDDDGNAKRQGSDV